MPIRPSPFQSALEHCKVWSYHFWGWSAWALYSNEQVYINFMDNEQVYINFMDSEQVYINFMDITEDLLYTRNIDVTTFFLIFGG